jgi:Zn-dependent peptidase ImmA (M78 family)
LGKTSFIEIEKLAIKLLKQSNISSLPIPIDVIARAQNADVVPYELGDEISGMLVINKDNGVIGYNSKHSKGRQRFTIAHELGHYLLHKDLNKELFVDKDFIVVKYRGNKNYSTEELKHEREANVFAAALLMPQLMIIKELEKKELQKLTENDLIEELAKTFDVSVPAMTYRLSELNIFDN